MLILGIESTCDETSCAIVEDGNKIRSLVIDSQIPIHEKFGGVVPELASRKHLEAIIPTIRRALEQASCPKNALDAIAVAQGPGLIGSLLVGIQAAKALSFALHIPLIAINHIEAHLYAAMMDVLHLSSYFPALGLIVSGGHTTLLKIDDIGVYAPLGHTIDDAAGEAFDKVSKILGKGYPGGPIVEKLAETGNPHAYPFKAGVVKNDPLSFSFSGLKTAVLYTFQKSSSANIADIAASFQEAVFQSICEKIKHAKELFPAKAIFFGGGVTQNMAFRKKMAHTFTTLPLFFPKPELCQDNAAMIAGLAYHTYKRNPRDEKDGLVPITSGIFSRKATK